MTLIQAGIGDVRGVRNTMRLQMPTPDEITLGVREYLDRENVAAIEAGDVLRELATERALGIARKNFPLA